MLERWLATASSRGGDAEAARRIYDDLVRRYAEPHRRYHTIEHIRDVLDRLNPDPLPALAAWFHDAIYDTQRTDNEAQSAVLAAAAMRELQFGEEEIEVVTRAIRATAKHEPDDLPPAMLAFLDADLAILGTDRARYDRYAAQIRQEYAWVPEEVYRRERVRILRAFLDRPRIYFVDAAAEAKARANIAREIRALTPPSFGAALATLILILYTVGQTVMAFGAAVFAIVVLVIANGKPPDANQIVGDLLAPAIAASAAGGAFAVAAFGWLWARHLRSERGPGGVGWRIGTARQHLLAAVGGIGLASAWYLTMAHLIRPPTPSQSGVLTQALIRPGWESVLLGITVVILAPPVEEILFRGVMLAGYARRFGVVTGSIVVTTVFVALHLPETIHYPPAIVAITTLAICLLLVRLATDSIAVSTMFHVAYNGTLIATAMSLRLSLF